MKPRQWLSSTTHSSSRIKSSSTRFMDMSCEKGRDGTRWRWLVSLVSPELLLSRWLANWSKELVGRWNWTRTVSGVFFRKRFRRTSRSNYVGERRYGYPTHAP